jgi:predicted phosphoribosyltransferase
MKPTGVRALSRRQGVTIKEIAKVMGCSYVTLVRKINKPGGIQLTLSSDRRVEMTEENFANLNLSKQQINELKVIERKRTGSS